MTAKNAAARRAKKGKKADETNEPVDDVKISIETPNGAIAEGLTLGDLEHFADSVNQLTGEISHDAFHGVPEMSQAAEGDELAPRTPSEHVAKIRARYERLHQWRLVLESRKEELKIAASKVEVAEGVVEDLCAAQRESDAEQLELEGMSDRTPEGMQRAIRAAYERLIGVRLELGNAKSAVKDAKVKTESAMFQLERAIRGEWGLPFAAPIEEHHLS